MRFRNKEIRDEEKMSVLDLVNSAAQAAKSGPMALVKMLRRRFYIRLISKEKECAWSYAPRGGLSLLVPVRWCPSRDIPNEALCNLTMYAT